VRARFPGVEALLRRLSAFPSLDAALHALGEGGDDAFAALVEIVHAAYYADPRSWASIGYTTHLPGRP
jgi:hypothetical protein